ncbi:hypothetical protein AVEN_78852-1 [Araneus ventricosus]|uniref:Uncharacterized protein n=1 Tax=Araneus ventricosus TaxID=182803 RepID=A0A4Y2NV35_ARAVE|nr:hypothetical protein AVEN_78852-1 [Araneus ventricosus]
MQKVNEIFGFLSPKQLTTLDNKTLREKASTLRNLYRDDLDKDELSVEIESFKYTVRKNYSEMVNMSDMNPLMWCGSLEREVRAQVSSSSSNHGSKLRGPSQNSPRVASKRDVNMTKLNLAT